MINPDAFCLALKKAGYSFVTGVPTHCLRNYQKILSKNLKKIILFLLMKAQLLDLQ